MLYLFPIGFLSFSDRKFTTFSPTRTPPVLFFHKITSFHPPPSPFPLQSALAPRRGAVDGRVFAPTQGLRATRLPPA